MKNLSRGTKIALLVTAIVLVSGGGVGGFFGVRKHRANKKAANTKASN